MTTTVASDIRAEDLTPRARIRGAAMDEFAAKGFKGATMRGIASAAGVSLGLVQHHFGTKERLRAACDEYVTDMVRFKVDAIEEGTLTDPQVLSGLMAMAPRAQKYMGRALVDGSTRIDELLDDVMAITEEFLAFQWPQAFQPGDPKTRDAAALMIAFSTATMVLQEQIARRMGVEPWSEDAFLRIGSASFDVYEAIGQMVNSDWWREVRAAVDTYTESKE